MSRLPQYLHQIVGFDIDPGKNRLLYMSNNVLRSVNTDGTEDTALSILDATGQVELFSGIDNKLYYIESLGNTVRRVNIDGSKEEVVFSIPGPDRILSAVLFPNPARETRLQEEDANITNKVDLYPNPFKDEANIAIHVKEQQQVTIRFFDVLGRQVSSTQIETLQPGRNLIRWSGGGKVANGIYYVHITNGQTLVATDKLIKCCG